MDENWLSYDHMESGDLSLTEGVWMSCWGTSFKLHGYCQASLTGTGDETGNGDKDGDGNGKWKGTPRWRLSLLELLMEPKWKDILTF